MLPSGTFYVIRNESTGAYFNRGVWSLKFLPTSFYVSEETARRAIKGRTNFNGKNISIVEFSFVPTANSAIGTLGVAELFRGVKRCVYCDEHSLYIRHNRAIWRPKYSTIATWKPLSWHLKQDVWDIVDCQNGSWASKHDKVYIDNFGHVHVKVERLNGSFDKRLEQWYNHGISHACMNTTSRKCCWSPAAAPPEKE